MGWKNIQDIESWNIIKNDIENPFRNEHSARLINPDSLDPIRVRRSSGSGEGTVQGKKIPATIDIIWFIVKSDGKEVPRAQALRFPISKWTESTARSWLSTNKIKSILFEPAKKGNQNFKCYEIVNNKSGPADIYIFGPIGGFDVDAKTFNDEFKKVTTDEVNVHINSPGGLVVEGFAIYNIMKESDKKINMFVKGAAMSISALIMLAGDVINVPENSLIVIHEALIGCMRGNADELEKEAKMLRKIDGLLASTIAKRSGKPEAEIRKLMKEETLFTGKEAVDFGLADNLLEPLKEAAIFDISTFNYKNLDNYTSIMQNFRKQENYTDNETGSNIPDPNPGGQEMEWNEAQVTFKSQIDALIAEASKEGVKLALPEAVKKAMENEKTRIDGIESLAVEGSEEIKKIIDDAKKDKEQNKETVAVKIVDLQNKKAKDEKDKKDKDNEKLNQAAEGIQTEGDVTAEEQKVADEEAEKIGKEVNEENQK